MKTTLTLSLLLALTATASAQSGAWAFPCPTNEIAHYTALRVAEPIEVNGDIAKPCWRAAEKSPRFKDILTGQPVIHDTRAMVLWNEENLYVAYQVEEPFVHARFKHHDDFIYQDNDVEFFLAGPDSYYEFEINAYNTCYEVFFIWEEAYERAGFSQVPEFARGNLRPFNGVAFTHHPRGKRLGDFTWTFPGMQKATRIDGTVNDDTDRDRGWSVELAFPWKGMKWLATDGRSLPPKNGDVWRLDFSRFNTYKEAPPAKDSGGWFWTRHGVWDSHIPECFVFVTFSTNLVGQAR